MGFAPKVPVVPKVGSLFQKSLIRRLVLVPYIELTRYGYLRAGEVYANSTA